MLNLIYILLVTLAAVMGAWTAYRHAPTQPAFLWCMAGGVYGIMLGIMLSAFVWAWVPHTLVN